MQKKKNISFNASVFLGPVEVLGPLWKPVKALRCKNSKTLVLKILDLNTLKALKSVTWNINTYLLHFFLSRESDETFYF